MKTIPGLRDMSMIVWFEMNLVLEFFHIGEIPNILYYLFKYFATSKANLMTFDGGCLWHGSNFHANMN